MPRAYDRVEVGALAPTGTSSIYMTDFGNLPLGKVPPGPPGGRFYIFCAVSPAVPEASRKGKWSWKVFFAMGQVFESRMGSAQYHDLISGK